MSLSIQNLHAKITDREILRGLSLEIPKGEVHAIMGKNGSGKSTLAKVMAGHPTYEVTSGDVLLDGKSLLGLEPDERSRAGLFLAFQYPMEVPGVTIANFLRAAVQARLPKGEELDAVEYYETLYSKMDTLGKTRSIAMQQSIVPENQAGGVFTQADGGVNQVPLILHSGGRLP